MYGKDFLGGGWKFPLQIDPKTGRIAMTDGEENIRESIGSLLRTYRGERVMRPEFGTRTPDYAFAPSSSSLKESIAYELSRQLVVQEPRIRDVRVRCGEPSGHSGAMVIQVSYSVRSTNNRYNQVYPFYMAEETRE